MWTVETFLGDINVVVLKMHFSSPLWGHNWLTAPRASSSGPTTALHSDHILPGLLPASNWTQWACQHRALPARCETPLTGDLSSGLPHQPDGNFHNTVLWSEMPLDWLSILLSPLLRGQTCTAVRGSSTFSSFLFIFFNRILPLNLWLVLAFALWRMGTYIVIIVVGSHSLHPWAQSSYLLHQV